MPRPRTRPELNTLTTPDGARSHLLTKYGTATVELLRSVLDTAVDLRRTVRVAEALGPEIRGVRVQARRRYRPTAGELEVRVPADPRVRAALERPLATLVRLRDELRTFLSIPEQKPSVVLPAVIRRRGLRLEAWIVVHAADAVGAARPDEYDLLALENMGPRPLRAASSRTARARWEQWRYALGLTKPFEHALRLATMRMQRQIR